MIPGLEIGMLIAGIIALATGKFTLSKKRIAKGTAARVAGVVLLLPLPLAFAAGFVIGLTCTAQGVPFRAEDWKFDLALIEGTIILGCLILAIVIAYSHSRPPESTAASMRNTVGWAEPVEDEALDVMPVGGSEAIQPRPVPVWSPPVPLRMDRAGKKPDVRRGNRNVVPWIVGGAAFFVVLVVAGCLLFFYWVRSQQSVPTPATYAQGDNLTPGENHQGAPPFNLEQYRAALRERERKMFPDKQTKQQVPPPAPGPIPVPTPGPIPAPAPVPINPLVLPPIPAAVAIKPPVLLQERVVVQLPSPVSDVTVGGGGRYLILHLSQQRQLAVFDVNEGKVVKSLPISADKIKIAAGMDKLIVVLCDTKMVQRWSLATWEREAEAPFAMKVPVVSTAMGSASDGPLLIEGCNWPSLGECVFFDILQMKKLELPSDPHSFFDTEPNVFVRGSANGRVFANMSYSGVQTCVLTNGQIQRYRGQGGRYPVPGPDGKVIYTQKGQCNVQLQPLGGDRPAWPAHCSLYYLTMGPTRGDLKIHRVGEVQSLLTIQGIEGAEEPTGESRSGLSLDRRIHFVPDAKLLITIPPTNDQLILRRVDVTRR